MYPVMFGFSLNTKGIKMLNLPVTNISHPAALYILVTQCVDLFLICISHLAGCIKLSKVQIAHDGFLGLGHILS